MNPSGFFDGVSDWTQCTAALAGRTDLERGTAFEHIVRHHLRTDPVYRTKLADVWLYHEVPADVRTRLNLPPRDEGIDVIARTHTGEFWAIQAKYRSDTDAALTHRELATFTSLAFTVCREISFALVCTTTARIPGLLQNLPHLGDLTAETWTALGPGFFASLRDSLAAATPAPLALPTPRTPLPHQSRAIAAAHTHFVENAATRGKLISPCGSGKSLTACWIAEKLGARRILIAVPSLALVRQTLETWMREALASGRSADWLCVCSDDEVSDTDSAELFAHVHELGLPCDTSPTILAAHLRAARDRSNQLVVLTTYQSSPLLASAAREAGFSFDFAVLDEAHKTTGRTRGVFAHLLHDENLPLPRRLFMTATERRFQGSSDDIVSMDDPALYGETFELLTFRDAIAATPPILSDYRILTIGVRESDVARLIEQNRWLDLGADGLDEVTATALASLIALRRATAVHGVRHIVSFHSSIARAKQFRDLCARLNSALPDTAIAAHHVNGAMGSAARQRELDRFLAAAPSLVTNARCLTEGVDLPSIDCVFFADPKGSTIEIVQAAGRALRLAPDKTLGYILLPLVVPDGATLDDIATSSAFKFVLFVLRALATHDDRIIEWFRATAESRSPEVSQLIHFDLGEIITPLGTNPEEFAKHIEVKCWTSIAKLNWRPFAEAREWARNSGITKSTDWLRIWKAGGIPRDIPLAPYTAYKGKGWIDWGDFLGFRRPATKKEILDHETARNFAIKLGLKHGTQWTAYARRGLEGKPPLPPNIPRNPQAAYRGRGWISWHHWLGLERPHRRRRPMGVEYRRFEEARQFVRQLNLAGQRHWRRYCRGLLNGYAPLPDDIPSAPETIYTDQGWSGYPDWLGTVTVASRRIAPRNFSDARAFVRQLGLTSIQQWRLYCSAKLPNLSLKPADIPRTPDRVYENAGWIDWGDWLGTPFKLVLRVGTRKSRFRDFESARQFARSLRLSGSLAWQEYAKGTLKDTPPLPEDIPASPRNVYAKFWEGWGDWLGTGNFAPFEKPLRSFEQARIFARTLGFRTYEQWMAWSRVPGNRPIDIPSNPATTYRHQGWISWPDFLHPPAPEQHDRTEGSNPPQPA